MRPAVRLTHGGGSARLRSTTVASEKSPPEPDSPTRESVTQPDSARLRASAMPSLRLLLLLLAVGIGLGFRAERTVGFGAKTIFDLMNFFQHRLAQAQVLRDDQHDDLELVLGAPVDLFEGLFFLCRAEHALCHV